MQQIIANSCKDTYLVQVSVPPLDCFSYYEENNSFLFILLSKCFIVTYTHAEASNRFAAFGSEAQKIWPVDLVD